MGTVHSKLGTGMATYDPWSGGGGGRGLGDYFAVDSMSLPPSLTGAMNLITALIVLFIFLHLWRQYGKGLKDYCEFKVQGTNALISQGHFGSMCVCVCVGGLFHSKRVYNTGRCI